jgi:hypothetical protein
MYKWTDDQGGVHYTQGMDSVPARFRPNALMMAFPDRPVAPVANPSPGDAAAGSTTRIPFTPGKPIMVSAKVNGGSTANLMLDTGASVTVINPRVLAGMGIGSTQAIRGSVKGATGSADVAAHDVDLGQGDGLLGRDFLDQFKVTIDSTAGIVTIAPK